MNIKVTRRCTFIYFLFSISCNNCQLNIRYSTTFFLLCMSILYTFKLSFLKSEVCSTVRIKLTLSIFTELSKLLAHFDF